jgi:adenosylhomocysteine nucleosidase
MVLANLGHTHTGVGGLMRLLFVASDPMEFRGILGSLDKPQQTCATTRWARSGKMGAHRVFLSANGIGWRRAAEAVDSAYSAFHPDAVISTGFCGALDPKLKIADVVAATCIMPCGDKTSALPPSRTAESGPVISIDHVAHTAEEKHALHAQGAIAVEMEAAGVAERARALGLPFYCVRAVTDTASEDMANDFNAALRPDGHFDTMLIFRHALRHPVARLPELIRLRRDCERAARTLGEFFADCRF